MILQWALTPTIQNKVAKITIQIFKSYDYAITFTPNDSDFKQNFVMYPNCEKNRKTIDYLRSCPVSITINSSPISTITNIQVYSRVSYLDSWNHAIS